MSTIYVIDTSALIQMKNDLPADVFPKLWDFLSELVAEGRLIAPHEVLREIEKGDDELVGWARANIRMFVELDTSQIDVVGRLGAMVTGLIKDEETDPEADPLVVALAEVTRRASVAVLVVANESWNAPQKIPRLCKLLDLDCAKHLELFRREGKTF